MTEVRGARRAAEKAARERLAGPLINAAGDLGVAVAQQQAAVVGVGAAEQRAREHVRQAQAEADAMVTEARSQVGAAEDDYRQAHEAAVTAGWSPAALADMGYAAPPHAAPVAPLPHPPARTAPRATTSALPAVRASRSTRRDVASLVAVRQGRERCRGGVRLRQGHRRRRHLTPLPWPAPGAATGCRLRRQAVLDRCQPPADRRVRSAVPSDPGARPEPRLARRPRACIQG